jgi:hypothetical protein
MEVLLAEGAQPTQPAPPLGGCRPSAGQLLRGELNVRCPCYQTRPCPLHSSSRPGTETGLSIVFILIYLLPPTSNHVKKICL